jgi:hypothetical protein
MYLNEKLYDSHSAKIEYKKHKPTYEGTDQSPGIVLKDRGVSGFLNRYQRARIIN